MYTLNPNDEFTKDQIDRLNKIDRYFEERETEITIRINDKNAFSIITNPSTVQSYGAAEYSRALRSFMNDMVKDAGNVKDVQVNIYKSQGYSEREYQEAIQAKKGTRYLSNVVDMALLERLIAD